MNETIENIISNYNGCYYSISETRKANAKTIIDAKINDTMSKIEFLPNVLESIKKYGEKVYNKRFFDFLEKELTSLYNKNVHVYKPTSYEWEKKKLRFYRWDKTQNSNDLSIELANAADCVTNNRVDIKKFEDLINKTIENEKGYLKDLQFQKDNFDVLVSELDNITKTYNSITRVMNGDVINSLGLKGHI